MSNVMGLTRFQIDAFRRGTAKVSGTFRVSETRICPGCKRTRSVRQFVEGRRLCLDCRRPR